jgi:hypothetical protein
MRLHVRVLAGFLCNTGADIVFLLSYHEDNSDVFRYAPF